MAKKNRLYKALKHPEWLFGVILRRTFGRWLDDRTFIKLEYFSGMRSFPNLEHPRLYNEKLQWLKLNDIHPEYARLVDKYEVKGYVAKIIGEEYIIPTLGVYDSFDEIDFDQLPNQFVLKTTHDSGGNFICTDKTVLNKKKARKKIERNLKQNFFYDHREYPYKYLKPRIIAEQFMVDESCSDLKDYKFFCFDGKCKLFLIMSERQTPEGPFLTYFDLDFNKLPCTQEYPVHPVTPTKPDNFEEMIRIVEKLSIGYPHVRVDLYNVNGKIYFGELTFFSGAGNTPILPVEWDRKIGDMLILPE